MERYTEGNGLSINKIVMGEISSVYEDKFDVSFALLVKQYLEVINLYSIRY